MTSMLKINDKTVTLYETISHLY